MKKLNSRTRIYPFRCGWESIGKDKKKIVSRSKLHSHCTTQHERKVIRLFLKKKKSERTLEEKNTKCVNVQGTNYMRVWCPTFLSTILFPVSNPGKKKKKKN